MIFTFYLVEHIDVSHNNTAVTIFGRLKVLNNMRFPIKVLAMRVYYLMKKWANACFFAEHAMMQNYYIVYSVV